MKLLVAQICACAVLAAFAASTVAHEGATGVVKARMDSMEEMGRAVKRIKARLDKGGDLAGVVRDAKAIQSAAQKMPSLFPVGSHDGHSDAKPNVWQHWPAFVKAANALEREAEKLGNVAEKAGFKDAAVQFRSMTRTCGACHEAFRVTK